MPYYVKRDGFIDGPLESGELKKLAAAGQLQGQLVGRAPNGPWTPAEKIAGLAGASPPRPPLPEPPQPLHPSPPGPSVMPVEVVAYHKDASRGTWRFYLRRSVPQFAVSFLISLIGTVVFFASTLWGSDPFSAAFWMLCSLAAAIFYVAAIGNGLVALYKFLMQV